MTQAAASIISFPVFAALVMGARRDWKSIVNSWWDWRRKRNTDASTGEIVNEYEYNLEYDFSFNTLTT